MTLAAETPRILAPAQADHRWLWLGAGAALSLVAVGGRWDLPLAAWLAPVALLRFARLSAPGMGVGLVWIVSMISALFWIWQMAVPVNAITLLAGGVFGTVATLPYLLDRLAAAQLGSIGRLMLFPAALAACEFLMATFSPLGTAYGLHAVTQRDNLALMQVISLTGPYAIGFLIGWLATVANDALEKGWDWRRVRGAAVSYAAVLLAVIAGGEARLAIAPAPLSQTVRIAGISPSTAAVAPLYKVLGAPPQADADAQKVDPAALRAASQPAVDELLANTRLAAARGAKIVLWSENAATLPEADVPALMAAAQAVARSEKIYLSIAVKTYLNAPPYGSDATHMIGPDGQVLWTYHKARPIPGLEGYTPGGAPAPVIDTPYGRVANVICYDADFPALMGVETDIMLVPGGDWPEMGRVHTGMASLRAIENGYALFRQDYIGHSAAFDYQGHVLAAQDTTGPDAYMLVADVPTRSAVTLYRLTGDVFAWACVLAVLALLLQSGARRRRTA